MAEQDNTCAPAQSDTCAVPPPGGISALWKQEDWLAVWVGFLIIALVLFFHFTKSLDLNQIAPTYKWTTQGQIASLTPQWINAIDPMIQNAEKAGEQGTANRLKGLREAITKGDRKEIGAAADRVDRVGGLAGALGKEISTHAKALPKKIYGGEAVWRGIKIFILYIIVAVVGLKLLGANIGRFLAGFPIVFLLAWLSRIMAGNALPVEWGIEYVIFALVIGLLCSNFFKLPEWFMEAVRTEYYIKSGLVVLGAGLLFFEIVQAGFLGILQALAVIFVVWYACFWLCRKLKVDDDFAAVLSSAVSICGVSAAIASCGAIQGDKKKLSYVTSLVLIVAVPMMVLMPWAAKYFGIPDLVAGAWLGGTLDTSGSVVAAGALISEAAMKTGVIVKFSQNALIGVAAFILAIWWSFKQGAQTGEKPSAIVIWERFPKFVLGFIVASVIFSFFLHIDTVNATKSTLNELRTWWFALAFVSIGLETRFKDMLTMEGGRPALAFITAQAFNVVWTLILAYLLFGGILFAVPDIR
jgi:uncharacterized integral membrane protein (TIGR00698 family)